jgi:hypothetical protein
VTTREWHPTPGKPRSEVLIEAAVEVGPALFFSLLVITVSFLPIFTLEAQEGRLFKPLAYTKTFAIGGRRGASRLAPDRGRSDSRCHSRDLRSREGLHGTEKCGNITIDCGC